MVAEKISLEGHERRAGPGQEWLTRAPRFLIVLFFVLGSGYLVLQHEYQEGHFFYYFFKANLYYSRFNKIVFPVHFWGCLALTLIVLRGFSGIRLDRRHIMSFLRYGLLFHLYLLLLSHSLEVTPEFTLVPTKIPSAPHFIQYEQFFMATSFVAYYLFAVHVLFRKSWLEYKLGEGVLLVSITVPYFFLTTSQIHAVYLGVSLLLLLVFQNSRRLWSVIPEIDLCQKRWWPIALIFALGLVFRLWYAHYISLFGVNAAGFSADGPAYYKSAKAFLEGNLGDVNFWYSPFYSLYLAGFMRASGSSHGVVFYGQALIGSLAPVFVYLTARLLVGQRTAVIAGVLVATSHLCIHYSVVVNRACPLVVTIPAMVYLCLRIAKDSSPWKFIVFGILFGGTFYFGQETAPVLAAFFAYLIVKLFRQAVPPHRIMKSVAWIVVGIFIITFPVNWARFQHSGDWIPLGRSVLKDNRGDSTFSYSGNPYARKMIDMGFNPLKEPKESLAIFFQNPWEIFTLLAGKTLTEMPGFLLDPGGAFLMPLHFSLETFYGANLQFYIYLFVGVGLILFITRREIDPLDRMMILGVIVFQVLFSSLVIMGTFRFRAPITPLNLLLAAYAMKVFFFDSPRQYRVMREPLTVPSVNRVGVPPTRRGPLSKAALALVAAGLFVFGADALKPLLSQPKSAGYKQTFWLAYDESKKRVYSPSGIRLDASVFVFYESKQDHVSLDPTLSFKMCRALMFGMKPYYRLVVGGQFVGPPKQIPLGCSEVKEKLSALGTEGIISLLVYASSNGETGELQWHPINLGGDQSISVPVIFRSVPDYKLLEYTGRFKKYSLGYVKLSPPRIVSGS